MKKVVLSAIVAIATNVALAKLPKCEFYNDSKGEPLAATQCCPIDAGEDRNTACANETKQLKNALLGLSKAKRFIYSNGDVTRGPIMYMNSQTKETSHAVFNDYFVKNSASAIVDHYLVQQPNGRYFVYRDRKFDNTVKVDAHFPGDSGVNGLGIDVDFDSVTGLPSWVAGFPKAKTSPLEILYVRLNHDTDGAFFTVPNGNTTLNDNPLPSYKYIGEYVY